MTLIEAAGEPLRALLCGGDGPLAEVARLLGGSGVEVERVAALDELSGAARRLAPDLILIDAAEVADASAAASLLHRLAGSRSLGRAWAGLLLAPEAWLRGDGIGTAALVAEVQPRELPAALLAARARAVAETARAIEAGARRSERLQSLLEISRAVNSTLDSGAILYTIARKLAESMELVRCSFIVPDLALGMGRVIACKDDPNIHALEINLGNYPEIIQVLRSGKRVVVADVETDPIMAGIRKFADVFRDQSIMTIPLESQGEVIGVLQIRKKSQRKGFSPREIEFCELIANAAASALKNAQLYEDIERHNQELRQQKRELELLSSELKRKNQELIELQQIKEDFTAMIVHDLRSPMMIIQGVLDLLRHKHHAAGDDRDLIDDGIGVTKRIVSLINNLLEVSRLESGELTLEREPVPVPELVRDAVEPFRSLAQSRRIQLETRVEPGVPPLNADRRRLVQVLDNLVSNALHHTPEGGRVSVVASRGEGGAEHLTIEVEDSGAGIPAEDLPHIFKKFRQGRTGPGRKRGSGLGLTIVDLLVRAHGGAVSVESTPGKGSRFTVRLPSPKADVGALSTGSRGAGHH